MANVPIRRDELARQLHDFIAWLNEYGAEIGKPTNPYEVLRYKAYWRDTQTAGTHIIYAKENGLLTWTGGSLGHFRAYLAGLPLNVEPVAPAPVKKTKKRKATVKGKAPIRSALIARDGEGCWFCGKPMSEDDRTLEHLVPRSRGGPNTIDNFVLAHGHCNRKAADKPLVEKIAMRTAKASPQEKADG